MKRCLLAFILAATSVAASANPDVGVSVHVNQPGLYGRIDIGRVPAPPVLVYEQPVIIAPRRVVVEQPPLYLHVPPGHAKNWRRHCRKYGACGQPVYFVREDWYRRHYAPVYHDGHRHAEPIRVQGRHDHRHDRSHDHAPERRHDREHDHDHGHGHGRGRH